MLNKLYKLNTYKDLFVCYVRMSREFFKLLNPFVKSYNLYNSFQTNNQEINNIIRLYTIGATATLLLGNCVYALGTVENKQIKISKKYKFNRCGFTEFMIVDNNGKHYNVNNSLWYWKWDSIEDWNELEASNDVIVKYYGWRVPLFGLFPNIIMSIPSHKRFTHLEKQDNNNNNNNKLTDDEKKEVESAFYHYILKILTKNN